MDKYRCYYLITSKWISNCSPKYISTFQFIHVFQALLPSISRNVTADRYRQVLEPDFPLVLKKTSNFDAVDCSAPSGCTDFEISGDLALTACTCLQEPLEETCAGASGTHVGIQGEHRRRSRTCCRLSLGPSATLFTSAPGSLPMVSAWELTDTQAQHQ